MELEVQREKKLDDGVHNGTIIGIRYRDKPYHYTDVMIELADSFKLTVSYPTCVMKSSRLGLLLERFGAVIQEGSVVDPDIQLVGRGCTFQSITEKKGDKTYFKVIPESLKPLIVEEKVQ